VRTPALGRREAVLASRYIELGPADGRSVLWRGWAVACELHVMAIGGYGGADGYGGVALAVRWAGGGGADCVSAVDVEGWFAVD